MNGMNDATQPDWNSNPQKPVAFCQNCGKSLDAETVRKVGPAVYCEPCLAARLAGAPPNPAGQPPRPGYGPVFVGASVNGQPIASGVPNPGLAALLGLIPGVGAMYNEQYAKGIAHLLIFAILVMFSHISGFFVLFVLGWICYMAMEAHHTAKARRDGTPLPNPFGLNDIGERMGFGRSWPSGAPDFAAAARDAAEAAAAGVGAAAAGFGRPASPVTPPPSSSTAFAPWGAPSDAYRAAPGYTAPYTAQPYTPVPPYAPPYTAPYAPPYVPPVPPVPPHTPPPYGAPFTPIPPFTAPANRFPAGAVWLIGLGMFFLLSTLGVFHAVPRTALMGVVLLVLGAWVFLRRMTCTGQPLTYDGTPAYNLRVLRSLRGSVWLIVFGILALLDSFHLASWNYSWPWIIIVVGIMMLLERTVAHSAAAAAPTPAPAYVEGWDDPPAPPATPHSPDSRPDARPDSPAGGR